MEKRPKIIFVGNYKGGVGKTTSVLNFAEYFTQMGKRVLAIDLDPQSSLSEILVRNNDSLLTELEDARTLNYVFDLSILKRKKYQSLSLRFDQNIVQTYRKKNFDFIASSLFYRKGGMGLDELAVRMEDNVEYLSILKEFLESVLEGRDYDYVLIDCPPSNNLITRSAFLLSDYYIIPTILDGISANGVAHYIKTVKNTYQQYCGKSRENDKKQEDRKDDKADNKDKDDKDNEGDEDSVLLRHYFGKEPQLIGIFCTFIRGQVNYDAAWQNLKETVNKTYAKEAYFFTEEINNFIDIARSTEVGEISQARKDYQKLSERVLERLEELEQG